MPINFSIFTRLRRLKKPAINILGQRFGRLTPIGLLGSVIKITFWLCRCDCGEFAIIRGSKLRNGHTRSCGCLRQERRKTGNTTHGHVHNKKKSSTYRSWQHMKRRILNPQDRAFKNYGGRGLQLHEPWLKFENFLRDMGPSPTKKHSIERVDNERGYFPDNCIWATHAVQVMNTRKNRYLTANGETHCISEWARRQNIKDPSTICRRLKTGRSVEEAIGLIPLVDRRSRNGRRRKTPPRPSV